MTKPKAKQVKKEDVPAGDTQITINKLDFIRTRDALVTSWLTLENALRDATRAYINHTNAALSGSEVLDPSKLDLSQFIVLPNATTVDGDAKPERKKRAKKDPNAPKRPLTAYLLWLQDNRVSIHKDLGKDQTRGQISSEGTKLWHALPDSTKEDYKARYQKNQQQYVKDIAEYKASGAAVPTSPGEDEEAQIAEVLGNDEPKEEPDAVAAADSDASTSSDESDDDSDDEEPKEPTPPPKEPTPPPPKSASKSGRKKKAVAEVPASSPPVVASSPVKQKGFSAINGAASTKRKAAAKAEATEEPKKKRSKKDAAADIAETPAPLPTEVSVSSPVAEKKEKRTKKSRKSHGVDA